MSTDYEKEERWKGTRIVVDACVPEAKKPSIVKAINGLEGHLLFDANYRRVGRCTFAMGIGWVIHTFFA